MAPACFIRKIVLVVALLMLGVAGYAATSHAYGEVVGTYKMSLDLLFPKDGTSYKVGEQVSVSVKSSGYTGVKVMVKNQATGAEEELKVNLVQSEGTSQLSPKVWGGPWPTAGKQPGQYLFTVKGLVGNTVAPTGKTVTVSVVQPSGPAKLSFTEPAGGRQVKAGDKVNVIVKAQGVNKVEFFIRDLQSGVEKPRSIAHVQGSDVYSTTWSTEGLQKGNYQVIARGFGADGKKIVEESFTMTITGGAPALLPAGAVKTVEVPDVVGMTEYEAVTTLDKAGFKINPAQYVFTPKQDTWGRVVGQSLRAGTKATGPITITVGQR